mgnify:FL=1
MENIDFRKDLLVGLFKEYCDKYDELNAKFSAVPVAKYEYCNGVKGGVWRGYYNPSPMSDIVVGNANRGRCVMHPRKGCYYRYRYSFDANGKLFVVEDYSEEFGKPKPIIYFDERRRLCFAEDNSDQAAVSEPVLWQKEFLIYEVRRVIAPEYDIVLTPELVTMSVCDYDEQGRILRYDRLHWSKHDPIKYQDLSSEVYEYGENGLLEYAYWGRSFAGITEVDKYHFNHDDEGRIVSYDFFRKDGSLVTYEIPKSKRRNV